MDSKVKWGIALCTTLLVAGIYVDNKEAPPLDIKNISSVSYNNLLRNAKSNNVDAQYLLGQYYQRGNIEKGIPINREKALEWLKKAADNSHGPSAYEYAQLIAPSNPKEAQAYYNIAMQKGFTAAIFAQSQLKFHEATPESIKEGLTLLVYSATKAKDPLALAYLAVLQFEGAGVAKDRIQAVLNMQTAVATAPTPKTKKDWDEKQAAWFSTLTFQEQESLNERLMMGSVNSDDTFAAETSNPKVDISALLANLPINNPKPVGK